MSAPDAKIIGIDLGTTNSCVAVLEHGSASVLSNAEGARTTPSAISFLEDGDRVIGAVARRQAVIHPQRTITSIKRFMGRRMDEVDEESAMVPYKLAGGENGAVRVAIEGRDYSPEELSAMILGKLKADAEAYLGAEVAQAVITVPAYFNDAQRQATKAAAEIAGLEVLRLVNEPTAAALAYGFRQGREERLLVFDLGGGTFDVSVLEIGDDVFEVLATHGDNHLGGDDFDKAIVDWLVAGFKEEKSIDLSLDEGALQRLYEEAEKAKIELSTMPKCHISLPFISANESGPEHLEVELTRAKLAELCHGLIDRLVAPTRAAIDEAMEKSGPIDHVIVVGGMTRMPAVREKVSQLTGRDPHSGVNPDEAVGIGAAIQAGVLAGEVKEVLLLDVIPLSLGIETKGGVMTKIIEANTTIPVKVIENFTTADDNQQSVEVHVLQGEREMAVDNRSLGHIQLLGIPPATAGVPQIEVTFDVNSDGILNVSALDLGTGSHRSLEIKSATGLSDEEIEAARAEASANRADDAMAREVAEVKVSAEVVRDQAANLLRDHRDEMDEDELAEIERGHGELNVLLGDGEDVSVEVMRAAKDELLGDLQSFSTRLYGKRIDVEAEAETGRVLEPADLVIDEPDADFDVVG